jgi:hypothetical protein
MIAFFFDNLVHRFYKNKWKLEEEEKLLEYVLPKTLKLQFNHGDPEELVLFKYPSHYRHLKIGQYNIAFTSYFTFLAFVTAAIGIRSYLNKRSWKTLLAMSIISAISIQEARIGYNRIKDVRAIILKNGKQLQIETFQDGDTKYEMDLKDMRIISKPDNKDLVILIDVNHAKAKEFRFFFLEPSPGTVNNLTVFETVIFDKRYVKY